MLDQQFFCFFLLLFFFTEFRGAASNSAYYGYPELWILRYFAQRYHAVPSPAVWLFLRKTDDILLWKLTDN
jgi:hypothetical protein